MKELNTLKSLQETLQKLQGRRHELRSALNIIKGGTQKKFTLHAGDIKFDLCGEMDRGYTYNMKECYNMVKLGLIKGLDKQIDEMDDAIALQKADIILEMQAIQASLNK